MCMKRRCRWVISPHRGTASYVRYVHAVRHPTAPNSHVCNHIAKKLKSYICFAKVTFLESKRSRFGFHLVVSYSIYYPQSADFSVKFLPIFFRIFFPQNLNRWPAVIKKRLHKPLVYYWLLRFLFIPLLYIAIRILFWVFVGLFVGVVNDHNNYIVFISQDSCVSSSDPFYCLFG